MSAEVQHREIEVQTSPRNSNQQSPKLNQSQFGQAYIPTQYGRHKQSDNIQDQTSDTNLYDFKSNTDTLTITAAPQAKKKCVNCTTGPQYQRLKQQQTFLKLLFNQESFQKAEQMIIQQQQILVLQ